MPSNETDKNRFDVFLSHNSGDKPLVEKLAQRLQQDGITPWLDKWNLIPGEPWQPAIEDALDCSKTCAVFIGSDGVGPWQNEEMRAAIGRRVSEPGRFRAIPVLLPGARREQRNTLPRFLVATTWVEFSQSIDEAEPYRRLIAGIRGTPPGLQPGKLVIDGKCPYPGLRPFSEEDAPYFFGREARLQWLLNKLSSGADAGVDNRFLGIVGASGSGKSSLARAGLLSQLKQGRLDGSQDWAIIDCCPGPDPLESLAIAMDGHPILAAGISDYGDLIDRMSGEEQRLHRTVRRGLHGKPGRARALILVDQFEEVFTLCSDSDQRNAFFDNLLYASGVTGGRTIVVITMRADFFSQCSAHAGLAAALSDQLDLIPAMTNEELRHVIEDPAHLAGCALQPGLTELLIQEMEDESGALPLLQHALRELWERRNADGLLTVDAYNEIGRLEGALERQADVVFESLDEGQQNICRNVFLKLTKLGQGTEDTKRRVTVEELLPGDPASATAVREVIETLVNSRLVTSLGDQRPSIEVAHEALIRSWPRLRKWLDANREALQTYERLNQAACLWQENGRTDGYLLRGIPLLQAQQCAEEYGALLTDPDQAFLDACVDRIVRATAEVESSRIDQALDDLQPLKERAKPFLRKLLSNSPADSRAALHMSLALLDDDPQQVPVLRERMLHGALSEFTIVAQYLAPYRDALVEWLWDEATNDKNAPIRRFRSGMALSRHDPPCEENSARWDGVAGFLARYLIDSCVWNPSDYGQLAESLRAAYPILLNQLHDLLRNEPDPARQSWIANLLADYAADSPEQLVDFLCDANEKQFAVLFRKFREHESALELAQQEASRKPSITSTETEREIAAKRSANAAVAQFCMGDTDSVWPLLRHAPDPRLRSYLLHRLGPFGADCEAIVSRLETETDVTVRRALVLSLGTSWQTDQALYEMPDLVEKLFVLFHDDPDPGIHAATGWLLRQWNLSEKVTELEQRLATGRIEDRRSWYISRLGITFVVLPGPIEFRMGSPHTEKEREANEPLHTRRIDHGFVISNNLVTTELFREFLADHPEHFSADVSRYAPDPDCPQVTVSWYDGAAFCNWMNQREGIPEDQWCYAKNESGKYAVGMRTVENHTQRTGYRFPTESEWEYACRAEAQTSRFFGETEELLANYAWFQKNARDRTRHVGSLKPNEFGLFDMLGNAWEWCDDTYQDIDQDGHGTSAHEIEEERFVKDEEHRVLRGGSYNNHSRNLRCAYRACDSAPDTHYDLLGFRVARTFNV